MSEGYKQKALKGFGWMGSQQVMQRLFSYLKLAVLARILTPEKFGLFGIAGLVLSFLEIITETGINAFLIQNKDDIDEYVDSAWIVSIVRGTIISLTIFLTSPFIAHFFRASESIVVLRFISIIPLLRGFINPSVAGFLKSLNYKSEFIWKTGLFGIESIVTLIFALIYRTELSFVFGMLIGVCFEVILSHIVIKPRPKLLFNFSKAKTIINHGKWITVWGWFDYASSQGDDIVVGRVLDTYNLGIYQNAYKISTLPLTEIVNAINRVTFSIYVKISDDKKRLTNAFLKTSSYSLIVIVIGVLFLFFFPELVINILLGSAWLPAVSSLKILAVFGLCASLNALPNSVFLALKRQDIIAKLNALQFLIMLVLVVSLTKANGIVGTSWAVLLSSLCVVPVTYIALFKELKK